MSRSEVSPSGTTCSHARTSALSAVGARADVYVGCNTDLDADVDGDGDAFVDVHLHNVFHARANVDVDGEVDVEDSAHLHWCQCRSVWRSMCRRTCVCGFVEGL